MPRWLPIWHSSPKPGVWMGLEGSPARPCPAPQALRGCQVLSVPLLTLTQPSLRLPHPELPSVVIIGGENITAPFLQPLTLRCAGTGVPTPSLRWWKDGVALASSGGILQVRAEPWGWRGNLVQGRGLPGGRASAEPTQPGSAPWACVLAGPAEGRVLLAQRRSLELQLSEGERWGEGEYPQDQRGSLESECRTPPRKPDLTPCLTFLPLRSGVAWPLATS